jgi:hypothetical protein
LNSKHFRRGLTRKPHEYKPKSEIGKARALRKAEARTPATLDAVIAEDMLTVTQTDARGWFKHCG